jgi:hypothetical protein
MPVAHALRMALTPAIARTHLANPPICARVDLGLRNERTDARGLARSYYDHEPVTSPGDPRNDARSTCVHLEFLIVSSAVEFRIPAAGRHEALPLSLLQQQVWLSTLKGRKPAQVTTSFRLLGKLNAELLQAALDQIVARHTVLRTTFLGAGDDPAQVIGPPDQGFAFTSRDVVGGEGLAQICEQEMLDPLDPCGGAPVVGHVPSACC